MPSQFVRPQAPKKILKCRIYLYKVADIKIIDQQLDIKQNEIFNHFISECFTEDIHVQHYTA
jgi:hypothetical protein